MIQKHKRENPEIMCPQNNKIINVCLSKECINALRCNNIECGCCGKEAHKKCNNVIPLTKITNKINQSLEDCKRVMKNVIKDEE